MVNLKPTVNLPELPPELWVNIYQFATFVPGVLDPDLTIDFSPTSRRTRRRLLRDSLVTKRYLVRVCKQWQSLASPMLYETLYIGRGRTLISLSNTLKLSKEKEDALPHNRDRSLGWWTKRIDVAMRDHISIDGKGHDIPKEFALLSEIFLCLPNLTIINVGATAPSYFKEPLHPVVLESIAKTSGSCLRAFSWATFPAPEMIHWQSFLTKTPVIETIKWPSVMSFSDPIPPYDGPVPELKALKAVSTVVDDQPELTTLHLPSSLPLRHLCMMTTSSSGISPQKALLEKYGPGLTVVQLDDQIYPELQPNLHLLSQTCSNLSRLDISFSSTLDHWAEWPPLPGTIETLGLQYDRGRLPKKVYELLFGGLCAIKPGPKLRVIQLTDQMNVRDLYERHYRLLSESARRLVTLDLELHDHEGHLIQ